MAKMKSLKKKKTQSIMFLMSVIGILSLTACRQDTSVDHANSENEISLGTEEAEITNIENIEISTDTYSYVELEDGTLRLTAYHPSEPLKGKETLNVPEEIDGKKITVIGEGCFSDKEAFDSKDGKVTIVLPNGITTIEEYIFNFEERIKLIEIPDSVTEIKKEAFWISFDEEQWPSTSLIISCGKGSTAERYAIDQGIKYTYTGEDWTNGRIPYENDGYSFEYYGQYRMQGTYTDFCLVLYYNDDLSYTYDIVVLDKVTGKEIQRIICDVPCWAFYGIQLYDTLISEEDADFDNDPEMLVYRGGTGNQFAQCYECYDWDEKTQSYVENESFGVIRNPVIDAEEQVVRGSSRGSAVTHFYNTYAVIDGEFVEIEEVETEVTDDEVIIETYHFEDGKRVLVEKETRSR
ncbi:MAG: leucine-rich repeat protein [Lachnospiraceae bacterium]|nr:leucine-rich repeat protein [Lachnospiraceae bacterium]